MARAGFRQQATGWRFRGRLLGFFFAAFMSLWFACAFASAAGPLVTVALDGQPAPDVGAGVSYYGLGASALGAPAPTPPTINRGGQVAFYSGLSGAGVNTFNIVGLWTGSPANVHLAARAGDHAPGTPNGTTFSSFVKTLSSVLPLDNAVPIDAAGNVAFRATVRGVGVLGNDEGVWSGASGAVNLVARLGDSAPGQTGAVFRGDPVLYPGFSFSPPTLNDSGVIAFRGYMGGGSGVVLGNGVWSGTPGNVGLLARRGAPAPGSSTFGGAFPLTFTSPVVNGNGQVAFSAVAGFDHFRDSGIWIGTAGSLAVGALEGDHAPGTAAGTNFYSEFAPGLVSANTAGEIAFASMLTGGAANDSGIWAGLAGQLHVVARAGAAAPGAPVGVVFASPPPAFSTPVINGGGAVAFGAFLGGASINPSTDTGLWLADAQGLRLIAREGDQAPGAPPGSLFTDFATLPTGPVLNALDQVAFLASAFDGPGIWATDLAGNLRRVVGRGDVLEVAPGVFRTVNSVSFAGASGNEDGRPSGFNDLGQVAFWAGFTDGSTGIFISNAVASVPEPASLVLAASALVGLLTLARRRRLLGRRTR